MKGRLQLWRVATNILNKQPRIPYKGWSFSWGLGVGLTSLVRNTCKSLGPGRIIWINGLSMEYAHEMAIDSSYTARSVMRVPKELSRFVACIGSAGGQMEGQGHRNNREIHIFLWKGE
jgi:hypothetical protein